MTCAALERGSAVIEFALLISVLLLMVLGVFDFGLAIQQAMVVSNAARAGAEFGVTEGNSTNTTGMQNAATTAAIGVSGLSATASYWCTCSAGGSVVTCSSTCTNGDAPIKYVQVQTSATIPVLFRFSNLPLTIPLNGNAILRAE